MEDHDRALAMLIVSLVGAITYSAGLSPPGGRWGADNTDKGYVAGQPILLDKSHGRYLVFYYGNTVAFVSSMVLILILVKYDETRRRKVRTFVVLNVISLEAAYLAGASDGTSFNLPGAIVGIVLMAGVDVFLALHFIRN